MDKYSKLVWLVFVMIALAAVGYTTYSTLMLERFNIIYCDYWEEDGEEISECYDTYEEIPDEWFDEEGEVEDLENKISQDMDEVMKNELLEQGDTLLDARVEDATPTENTLVADTLDEAKQNTEGNLGNASVE